VKKQILFLMSDTGGGHRAAAEAIRDAMFLRYGQDQLDVTLVDAFRHSLFPLNYMPEFYPWIVNHSKTSWGTGYRLTNTRRRALVLSRSMSLTSGPLLRRMVKQNPADVVVCVHSIVARPVLDVYLTLEERPPFVTVVTDLVTTHMFWYDQRADRCLVPTQAAFERGLESGLDPEQMRVTGLPVHPKFTNLRDDIAAVRHELGWDPDLPVVMLIGGGEGMGPLYEMTRAINDRSLPCQLVIVAGRNKVLKERLQGSAWNQPTHVYGFVTDMPRLMVAADILVTKAGPATICEACIAGLPLILSDAIPGQETGNVNYVVQNNAGVYAPSPGAVADSVSQWLAEGEQGLRQRAENAHRLARPNAVWEIADEIWHYAQQPKIPNHRRRLLGELLEAPREIFPTLT
jgi:1,2-diacylglycerol 3-beta-galactosyltransferase